MPLISGHLESAMSAVKSRFGYQKNQQPDASSESAVKPPVKSCSSPDLSMKSAARENTFLLSSSYREKSSRFDDDGEAPSSNVTARSFDFREDPTFWKDHNVQVIIRIRPLSNSEISVQGNNRCVKQDSSQSVTWTGHPESRYTFDLVADETVSQETLFRVAGVPMVENCVEGYNSCIFAYGQTGSGKTHTMLGDIEGGARRHNVNCGMTPRVFEYMFSRIQKERDVRSDEKLKFTCRCSFLEIYNEQIFDLLDPSTNNLQIREDNKKGVYVENLTEIEVNSARDIMQQLIQGAANRKVAATNMNRASSRSHSVFTCVIESKWESQGVTRHRFARLNLVDLAGSERQKSSGAEGERLKEATNINKSLSTLGLVIMNLVNISNGKSQHVPYRDSKLTFLLQDSLGGNAKTLIIANISPSSCCSLETLSTLKFAQRAKFIKNHAIINEDASGDVLALKLENQNLKKEVSRLRSLVSGGVENHDGDIMSIAFPGSPGSFKWDGLRGLSSPLTSEKKSSRKKEYEVALVGAFRRDKDKEIALQALAAENQTALQLAKQREDEIKSLKLRLKFREAGIKRLQDVASGKISAEDHLLKEREEYLKEIEVLRAQVGRNQEATRFAMENLRLNEEIRRLKSFCEEGERENMLEQITALQNKLLEALDWKLMHESAAETIQKEAQNTSMDVQSDDFLSSNHLFGKGNSMNEENEFLRIQAIQNQSELDAVQKKLELCIEEKQKLERRVDDLTKEVEEERSLKEAAVAEKEQNQLLEHVPMVGQNDQTDIKTMVDAIATASQREAEAHERVFSMVKENDELRSKLKVLIEDNNKLIDLYERAVSENNKDSSNGQELKEEVDSLKHQLAEMHEENDKLLGLYEKAMQERDGLKRQITCDQPKEPEKVVEIDDGQCLMFGEVSPIHDVTHELNEEFQGEGMELNVQNGEDVLNTVEETELYDVHIHDSYDSQKSCHPDLEANPDPSFEVKSDSTEPTADDMMELDNLNDPEKQEGNEPMQNSQDLESKIPINLAKDLNILRERLLKVQEMLSCSAKAVTTFGDVEKAITDLNALMEKIEKLECGIHEKQQKSEYLKSLSSELQGRKELANNKLSALRQSLMNFSSSLQYFEQREAVARSRLKAPSLERKLSQLHTSKTALTASLSKLKKTETELRNNLQSLKSKVDEANQKLDSDKVLFAIDNVEKAQDRTWQISGKATELLRFEEETVKLHNQIKLNKAKLGEVRKETEVVNAEMVKVDSAIRAVESEVTAGEETEIKLKLQQVVAEKEMLLEMKERGLREYEEMIVEYYERLFEAELNTEEVKMVETEVAKELQELEGIRKVKGEGVRGACEKLIGWERMKEWISEVEMCVGEMKCLVDKLL